MTNFDHFLVNVGWYEPVKTTQFKPDRLKPEQPCTVYGTAQPDDEPSTVAIHNLLKYLLQCITEPHHIHIALELQGC